MDDVNAATGPNYAACFNECVAELGGEPIEPERVHVDGNLICILFDADEDESVRQLHMQALGIVARTHRSLLLQGALGLVA